MKEELEEHKETIDKLIRRLSAKETEAETYRSQLLELNKTHSKLQNIFEQAKNEGKILKEGDLEKKLYYKKQRIKQLKRTIDELMPKIGRCEDQIREFNEVLDESNRVLKEKNLEVLKLQQLVNDLNGENKKLKGIIDLTEEEIVSLKSSIRNEINHLTTIKNKEIETIKNSKDKEVNVLIEAKEKEISILKFSLYEAEERIKQITTETEKRIEDKHLVKHKDTIEQLKASLEYTTQDNNNVIYVLSIV
jgi:chromosome segregation ATPase